MDDVAAVGQRSQLTRTPGPLRLGGREFAPRRPLVMATLNRTPDSFRRPGLTWDASPTWDEGALLDRVHAVVAAGADILDVGGLPAEPDPEVPVSTEISRIASFIERVRAAHPDLVISADTGRHESARAMCAAGVDLINDTWSGRDGVLAEVAAEFGAGLVCSHGGTCGPPTRTNGPVLAAAGAEVLDRLLLLVERALEAGVDADRILIHPVRDFGESTWQSREITARLSELAATGWPVLLSPPHTDFAGEGRSAETQATETPVTEAPVTEAPATETPAAGIDERLAGTLAVTAVGAWLGVRIFRTHDVKETRQALDMVATIKGDRRPARTVRGLA